MFKSIVQRLSAGLTKTREAFVRGIRSVLLGRALSNELIDDVERRLIAGDVGVATTRRLIERVRADFVAGKIDRGDQVLDYLRSELKAMWPPADRALRFAPPGERPTVILIVGVNGAGKTTSIAKMCHMLATQGKRVILGACDTFRAGAVRQLEVWSERIGVEVVKGQQGGDPAAVAFDACAAAKARQADVLILDTAGRLHTQEPLMRQLAKIRSVVSRQIPGAPHEIMLVIDATAGNNALRQAEEFTKALTKSGDGSGVTGIFLAKLDGTAKGGIVIAIRDSLNIPVKFVGLGETPEDVAPFDPDRFIDAMFEEEGA